VSVGVAYDSDMSEALALIDEVLRNNSRILSDPAPVGADDAVGEWAGDDRSEAWVRMMTSARQPVRSIARSWRSP